MARPLPQIASFLLALIAAHAGLATAGPMAPGELPALSATVPVEAVPLDRSTATGVPTSALADVDWAAEIAGRLAALRDRPRPPDAAPASDPTLEALQHRLAAVLRHVGGARIGVHVRDLDSGRTLFDHHGDERYNPASNQKLVTAIAAVELLGPGYRFRTRVLRRDDTLVLVGEGDPSLQLTDLHALASEVIAAGAHHGVRRIAVDDSAFSPEHHGPGYSPQGDGASYTAPSGALSLAFNTAVVTIRATTPGQLASIDLGPPGAHLRLQGEVRTGRGRPLHVASRDADDLTVIEVDGALPAGHAPVTIRRRIADPGLFTGHAFAEVLHQLVEAHDDEWIPLPVIREQAGPHAREVATHFSAPLVEVLASSLKFSNNFTSEQVLRTLGWRMSGEPGSWATGRAAVLALWDALGLDRADLEFENGAGLSRHGRVSPRALVALLARTREEGSPAAALMPTLASAGGEGTLSRRMTGSDGRVRGKTGTISGVSALSGVAASADGRAALGFSVLINGGGAAKSHRRLQDRVVLALLGHLDRSP